MNGSQVVDPRRVFAENYPHHSRLHRTGGPDAIPEDERHLWNKGTDVASAGTLTLGNDANSFDITGTTTINYITTLGWRTGTLILLQFDGALTLTHNAGSVPANTAAIQTRLGVNITTKAGTYFLGWYDGTNWQEILHSGAADSTGRTLFDYFADAGNSHATNEIDLYSSTLAAGQFATNGDKVHAYYAGTLVGHATATRDLRVYCGGTAIFDSTGITLAVTGVFKINVEIIRVSASVIRSIVDAQIPGASLTSLTTYTNLAGLTLANTQILKLTGQAGGVGAAINDLIATLGAVSFEPAA